MWGVSLGSDSAWRLVKRQSKTRGGCLFFIYCGEVLAGSRVSFQKYYYKQVKYTLALATSISTSKAMLRLLLSYVYLHFLFGMHNVRGLQVASSTKNALPRAWWHKQVAEVVRTLVCGIKAGEEGVMAYLHSHHLPALLLSSSMNAN